VNIQFHYSFNKYKILDEIKVKNWIQFVIGKENKQLGNISYNFVSEDEILKINQDYLHHDYFTDIITFNECFVNIINGDIFISPDTIKSNSVELNYEFLKEFYRVIVHGIMHLCGYNDSTERQIVKMREMEDKYLSYLE
jgi:probable rRNA maturation factor